MTRRLLTGLITALLAGGFALLGAGPAAAHSTPVASDPAAGAEIGTGPARVSVTFNENLQPSFPSLTVVGPDGNRWDKGQPAVDGPTVSVPVGDLGPAGKYTIAFRVTSADGHPVSGTRTFTLTQPGKGTPGPKAGASSNSGDDGGSGGVPVWVFIVGAVVLFGGGLAVALLGGKKSRKKP
ncbi:copper resistance CopC family protein [Nocardia transvalensis]|uniref:copper resistance CopC family protein n=1 Tax=Nocardia transvalensis TaxID=37333 RepID=UPI00189335EE|nr:copper resistance CopC family protein [Nocardia transvalensis]MBF6328654.1 copper resistance protein CopC [Nocardia transvalensis]